MHRTVVFAIICMMSLAFLALLATQLLTPAQETTQRTVQNPLLGHKAPDFTLPVLSGSSASTFHFAALRGRPLILNFWASWCDACKEEAPLLQRTWQQIAPQGVVMIGIDFEDTSEAGKEFISHYGITYLNVSDTADGKTGITYGLTGVPETFFVDRHGIIIRKEIGALTEQVLQQDLHQLDTSTSPKDMALQMPSALPAFYDEEMDLLLAGEGARKAVRRWSD